MVVRLDRRLTVNWIAEVIGATLVGSSDASITSVVTDSREASSGALFVALKGEKSDGHAYIEKAVSLGADCILAERMPTAEIDCPIVLVPDTLVALGKLSAAYKSLTSPLTVAVTGSVGKTTTKEFVAAVLSQHYATTKTQGNFNNQLGLPLTLLSLKEKDEALVVEMGMSARGEIAYLSELACPKIGMITCIGSSHIEHLGSREGIRDAKMEITAGMGQGSILLLNGDEPLLAGVPGALYLSMKNRYADFYIRPIDQTENGSSFDLTFNGTTYESIVIPVIGEHNVWDAAYAFAVGLLCGMGEYEIRRGLMSFSNTGMRQNLYEANGIWILEDCYNAAPESVKASLSVLSKTAKAKGGRKIAVLGDIRELGAYTEEGHRQVGRAAAEEGVELLVTFGSDAAYIAKAAIAQGMPEAAVCSFTDLDHPEEVSGFLSGLLQKNDTVLFKASRAVRLERVIAYLK